jgi:hypothetical protein
VVELRAVGEHAVLVGRDESGRRRSVDPHSLAMSGELAEALHEWARVSAAVLHAEARTGHAGSLVSARGRQLAARLAAEMGTSVTYADPVTEEVALLDQPGLLKLVSRTPVAGFLARVKIDWLAAARSAEPTPWATGLAVTVFTAVIVVLTIVSLSAALHETSALLSVAANLVIAAGVSPSVWLLGRLPVWRWVAYGVLGGILLSWLAGLFAIL